MWIIDFTDKGRKAFKKLDHTVQARIVQYLALRVAPNPRRYGDALTGDKKGYWRYRIGDYRVIVNLQDEKLLVLVIHAGKRGDVYRVEL